MKGYRRAQLGWITATSLDGSRRQVELLVVYSAKSRQIELWNTRKASRVTAFAAPEGLGLLVIFLSYLFLHLVSRHSLLVMRTYAY